MTADLAEEHSTAMLAAERLEAEQSDRLKLEKDNLELNVSSIEYKYKKSQNNKTIFFFRAATSTCIRLTSEWRWSCCTAARST
jgi:myosin-18